MDDVLGVKDAGSLSTREQEWLLTAPSLSLSHSVQSGMSGSGGGIGGGEEDDDDSLFDDDYLLIPEDGQVSSVSTYINIVKDGLSAGVLAIPYALSCSGVTGGAFSLILLTIMNVYASVIAIRSSKLITKRTKSITNSTWAAIAYQAYGTPGSIFITVTLGGTIIGATSVFFILIGDTLESIEVDNEPIMGFRLWVFLSVPIAVLLCLPDNLSIFSYGGVLGLIAILGGYICVFVYGIRHFTFTVSRDDLAIKLGIAKFVGIAAFSNASVIIIVPMHDNMSHKHDIKNVLYGSQTSIALIYFVLGFLAYSLFDSDPEGIQQNIFLNLPKDTPLSLTVFLSLVCVIFLSLPIPVFIACSMAEISLIQSSLLGKFYARHAFVYKRILITVVVVLAGAIAIAFPNFGDLMSVLGCVTISLLSYVVPPLCHIKLMRDKKGGIEKGKGERGGEEDGLQGWEIFLHSLLAVLGVVVMIFGLYTTIFLFLK